MLISEVVFSFSIRENTFLLFKKLLCVLQFKDKKLSLLNAGIYN